MEAEVHYLITISKNKNLNESQMGIVYSKALDTLEVLMIKLGLDEPFNKVINFYDEMKS
jgi:hypothetical protein